MNTSQGLSRPDPEPGTSAAPPTSEPGLLRTPPRKSLHGSRFDRWHLEASTPVEEEGWLLTYLDVMTLLLVMMVVMLTFSGPPDQGARQAAPTPAAAASAAAPPVAAASDAALPLAATLPEPPSPAPTDPLGKLPLDKLGANVAVIKTAGGVRFRINAELLFTAGQAGLSAQGQQVLDRLVPTLNIATNQRIVVEGHGDNTPTGSASFPSAWELTAARAGSVVRHLQSSGVNPTRMRATGYGETQPIAPATSAAGQQANRRVELLLALPGKED